MIKKMKKGLSLFLSVLMLLMLFVPAVSALSYPEGITKEQSEKAIESADNAIFSLLKSMENATLKEVIGKEIYSSKTLSSLLVGAYKMLSEYEEDLKVMNIDISLKNVREGLSSYKNVYNVLLKYNSWSEIETIKANWGVKDKEGFSRAFGAAMSPFNEILYTLLSGGSFSLNTLVGIKGGKGYEKAIVPTYRALGVKSITDSAVFYAEGEENSSSMVYHIVYDILTFAEEVLDSPCDGLTKLLPRFAFFMENGGFENAVSALLEPLTLQLASITTFIKIKPLLSLIADPEAMTSEFDINALTANMGIKLPEINMAELASCATQNGENIESNQGDCFVILLRFLVEALKLNGDKIGELTSEFKIEGIDLEKALKGVLEKETDSLVSLFISFLSQTEGKKNDYKWTFGEFFSAEVNYTQNLSRDKFQRVLDGMDDLINEFVAEGGEYKTLGAMLKKEIYSPKTVKALATEMAKLFGSKELKSVASMLSIDGISTYVAYFKDGDSKGFIREMTRILSPFEELLSMLLIEGKANLMGIDFYGSDGYNSAVIPLLEALGCKAKTILTYEEFKNAAKKNGVIEPLLETAVNFINRFMKKPVYTVVEILPNFLYFIQNGGLGVAIENLLYPVTSLTDGLGMEGLIDLSFLKKIDINKTVKELLKNVDLGMKLPELDIASLGKMGALKEKESKRTFEGKPMKISYIEADGPAIMVTIVRFIAELMKTPGNESLTTGFMGGTGDGGNDMFATYSSGIGAELEKLSVDETVEWLYKIFFRERAVKAIKPADDYLPTIIYEGEKEHKVLKIVIILVILIVIAELIILKNKRKIERFIEDQKFKKKLKEQYEKGNSQEV